MSHHNYPDFAAMTKYFETHAEEGCYLPAMYAQIENFSGFTAHDLVAYYHKQTPAMQGALKSFWRTLCSTPHAGQVFDEALGLIHHEQHHTFAPF